MNRYDVILTIFILLSLATSLIVPSILKVKQLPATLTVLIGCIPLLICIAHYIFRGFNYVSLPLYFATLLFILKQMLKQKKTVSIIFSILIILVSITPSFFFLIMYYNETTVIDLASSSYVKSFEALHNEIQEVYPLSEHKNIDFESKYKEYLPLFKKADKDHSKAAYYTALLSYLKSYHDGHFFTYSIKKYLGMKDPLPKSLLSDEIGGSYGFTVIELTDGRIVVSYVKDNSLAQSVGLKQGMEITKWNGIPVKEAASNVSILWNYKYSSCANQYYIWRNQLSILTRAPFGEKVTISFKNEDGKEKDVTLTAEDDQLELLRKDFEVFYKTFPVDENLTYHVINGTHGYLLLNEMPEDDKNKSYNKFHKALENFQTAGVKDIIIDMRSNRGGYDEFGAHILELMASEPVFYLQELTYSRKTDVFTPYRDAIISTPHPVNLDIPIVILVNNQTISAGEGFVYNAGKLGNVQIAGMNGTNGSFGTIDDIYLMPENYIVSFPQIACVDQNDNIIIDTDENFIGGIQPDISIPIDEYAVQRLYTDQVDYELEYVIDYLEK